LPSCPASARFAHPREKERLNELSKSSGENNQCLNTIPQIHVKMVEEEKF